jgi:ATP-dependent RNA helicase RhlE
LNFQDFNLDESLQEGLSSMGFSKPSPIQEQAIPFVLAQKDLIACAQTGTGKTAAYLLPTIHQILHNARNGIKALVIAPTRELALQIDQQLQGFIYFTDISSICVYGGSDGAAFDREKIALRDGADIVIATPGKLLMHLKLGYVSFEQLEYFILDEADRMLDMGFYDDIMRIVGNLPAKRQNLMFSATMPPKIRSLAKQVLKDPEEINIAVSKPASGILQAAFMVYNHQKIPLIQHLLKAKPISSMLLFCATKKSVKELEQALKSLNLEVGAVHSDLEQDKREEVLRAFKNKQLPMIVATDVLSRGIDVEGIELVINYDVPSDAEDYVHRIGRTARADKKGAAFTLVNENDMYKFARIEQQLEMSITKAKLPEDMGEAPEYSIHKGKGAYQGRKKNGWRKGKQKKTRQ